jgi:hypothetical protein
MKKLSVMVLVSMVLLPLGMTSCASLLSGGKIKKLDISTLDRSQPVLVNEVYVVIDAINNEAFFAQNGKTLLNPQGEWQGNEADILLEALCGTVAGNWDFITERIQAKAGVTLDGDKLMQDLENGDSKAITSQKTKVLNRPSYRFSWASMELLSGITYANIYLAVSGETGKVSPFSITLVQLEVGELGTIEYSRQATISLR